MSKNVSIGAMIQKIDGLVGTKDLTQWEDEFIYNVVERTNKGKDTSRLSERQIEQVERIHNKHFA